MNRIASSHAQFIRTRLTLVAITSLGLAGCMAPSHLGKRQASHAIISASTAETPLLTLVWVGNGTAYRIRNDAKERTPSSDYTFTVTQRRYATHWESTKELHRLDPEYDGSAGPRDQTYVFRLEMPPLANRVGNAASPSRVTDTVSFRVLSTLGDGAGTSDTLFRSASLEFHARGVSRFAPYNTYRIAQTYSYERGELSETVSLFKKRDGAADVPFVEVAERATLFSPGSFASPPTSARGVRLAPK